MKVIYRGGYNKHDEGNLKSSTFYEYADAIKKFIKNGKSVVVVTFAKPDHYYDEMLIETLGKLPEIINTKTPNKVKWGFYDLVLLPGGNTLTLKEKLVAYGFTTNKLKKSVVIIGDSAGAYVMSKYFAGHRKTSTKENPEYRVEEGLYADSNLFTVAHINNPNHVTKEKIEMAKQSNKKLGSNILLLKENEAKLLENGQLVDFDIDILLATK